MLGLHCGESFSLAVVSGGYSLLWSAGFSLLWLLFVAEKAMAPHSSTLAWKIQWMEEPGRLQSMRSLRVGHD